MDESFDISIHMNIHRQQVELVDGVKILLDMCFI